MYEVIIRLPGRPETVGKLVAGNYRIGSSPAAHIQINLDDVSARHCLLMVKEGSLRIQDAGSKLGTFVDGRRIGAEPQPMDSGGSIEIGESRIIVRESGAKLKSSASAPASTSAPAAASNASASTPSAKASGPPKSAKGDRHLPMLAISGIPYEYRRVVQEIKREVHNELITRMNLKNLTMSGADSDQVREEARDTSTPS